MDVNFPTLKLHYTCYFDFEQILEDWEIWMCLMKDRTRDYQSWERSLCKKKTIEGTTRSQVKPKANHSLDMVWYSRVVGVWFTDCCCLRVARCARSRTQTSEDWLRWFMQYQPVSTTLEHLSWSCSMSVIENGLLRI